MGKLQQFRLLPLLTFMVVMLSGFGSFAQQNTFADSLLREIQTTSEDSTKFNLFLRLGLSYGNTSPQDYIDYAQKALDLARKMEDPEKTVLGINVVGIGYKRIGDLNKSLDYFTEGLEISRTHNLTESIPQFLNNLGLVHANRGDNIEAMKFYHEALNMLDETEDPLSVANLINNIGIIHSEQGNLDEALQYFERSLVIQRERQDSLGTSIALTNVGETHYELGRKEEALENYEEAQAISEAINDQYGVSYLLASMGEIFFDQEKFELANDNLFRALSIAESLDDVEGKVRILGLLGKVSQKQGRYTEANDFCFEALKLSMGMGLKQSTRDLYESISRNYKHLEDYESAYNYQVLYKEVNDSLFNDEKSRQLNELSIQYETRKKETEVQLLKEEQAKNEALLQRRTILGWSAVLLLLFVSFMAYSLNQRNKQRKRFNTQLRKEVAERTSELEHSNVQLEKSNKELEQFAYITSHDLKEPLRNIISFTDLIERKIKTDIDEETEDYMHTVKSNARQMHSLIEGVLEFARIENIDFNKEIVDLNSIMNRIKGVLQVTLAERDVKLKIGNLHQVVGNGSQLFLVLKNLVENAMKYNNSKVPKIEVSSEVLDGKVLVSVKDNGIGIDEDYHNKIFDMFQRLHIRREYKGAGLGLSICKKIVENLGGNIWVESKPGKGSKFTFSVPVAEKSVPATEAAEVS